MAVEIVGCKDEGTRQITCKCCDAVLRYKKDDVKFVGEGLPENMQAPCILCPQCHRSVWLPGRM